VAYSHDGTQLAKGLSTGDAKVFDSMSDHHLFTLRGPATTSEVPSPATSLAYSRDDGKFAVGYQSGVLKLWKGL